METTADLLALDTSGEEPTLDALTELEGNTPTPNIPSALAPFARLASYGESTYILPEPPADY